jgi:ligand-binding sensor domain-containing protein
VRPRSTGACLFACLALLALAAAPAAAEWRAYGVPDGLASHVVRAVCEDRDRRLWFGGEHGATSSDGNAWSTVWADHSIHAALVDRRGAVWLGSDAGVFRLDAAGWTHWTTAEGLGSDSVYALAEDQGGMWAVGRAGAARFDGTAWQRFTRVDGLGSDIVQTVFVDRQGAVWFGTMGGGVTRYDAGSWRTFTTADGLAEDYVSAIVEDASGVFWFCTNDLGVSRWDGSTWSTITTRDGLPDNAMLCATLTSRGEVWFGTRLGAIRFDGWSWQAYGISDGLAGEAVYAIAEERSGNLWFGTDNGVSRFDQSETHVLPPRYAHSCYQDSLGQLWFGTTSGAVRFDGRLWSTLNASNGLASDDVQAVLRDRAGVLWFGTSSGLTRIDSTTVRTFTHQDGLPNDLVLSLFEDRSGTLWAGTDNGGLARFDGTAWTAFPQVVSVTEIMQDHLGNLWFASRARGAWRFDGTTWRQSLATVGVVSILEDHAGVLWFGTWGDGVYRLDGADWTHITTADGLVSNLVNAIVEDGRGILWFGTGAGLSRWDGQAWHTLGTADGLPDIVLVDLIEDRHGRLWFATDAGIGRHDPDRVPARSVIVQRPPGVSSSRLQTIPFAAAFGESRPVAFSWSFDDAGWSDWSTAATWVQDGLSDGTHTFRVRTRDWLGQADSVPAACVFEIDGTSPDPIIASPRYGDVVRDTVIVRGETQETRFRDYRLEIRPSGSASWDPPTALLIASSARSASGPLGSFDSRVLPDGDYELRLSVSDTLGLTGRTVVRVTVDNQPPWADVTSPARVEAASGGNIYTVDGTAHLYVPPHSVPRDATVSLIPISPDSLPAAATSGGRSFVCGIVLDWGGVTPLKDALLDLHWASGQASGDPARLAVYGEGQDSVWRRLGGTVAMDSRVVSLALRDGGRYALMAGVPPTTTAGDLSAMNILPRVFSPHGRFGTAQASISFVLGRSGPVTIWIHNRAGRLVRKLLDHGWMSAGVNVVRWDGRTDGGESAQDGIYLATVETSGQTVTKPFAVAN